MSAVEFDDYANIIEIEPEEKIEYFCMTVYYMISGNEHYRKFKFPIGEHVKYKSNFYELNENGLSVWGNTKLDDDLSYEFWHVSIRDYSRMHYHFVKE